MSNRSVKCRVCGCTEERACITESGPCYWVAPDLCSACVPVDERGQLKLSPLDLAALERAEDIPVVLPAVAGMQVMAALQLALRHPAFPENSRETIMELCLGLAQRVGVTPNLQKLCMAGFDPQHDVPTEERRDRLILPGEPGFGL